MCERVHELANVRQYCKVLWVATSYKKVQYKCSPFTIYHPISMRQLCRTMETWERLRKGLKLEQSLCKLYYRHEAQRQVLCNQTHPGYHFSPVIALCIATTYSYAAGIYLSADYIS